MNAWATGNRSDYTLPEAPLHGQFHATFEPSIGITPFWELGGYYQTALRTDVGTYEFAGAKLRSKFVTPPDWDAHWRVGVNFEASCIPPTYDHSQWGGEIRPIVAWHDEKWLFVVNPILDFAFKGPDATLGPDLSPAVKVARTFGPIALGFEYYADLGPIGSLSPWSRQIQQVYEVFDLLSVEHLELNVGVGEGLTSSSAGVVIKTIIGWELEFEALTHPSNVAGHRNATIGL